ncbi:Tex-like N-terminal domain-containing protein, partial [Streptomyces prasinus]|uniref:Tex-like N-terminal domain-containing protein n=1 Tax=Streptomyces prasinus TaxID=67345 RepID=UPI0036774314
MTTPLQGSIEGRIAGELGVQERQVRAAVELLDGGSTVPFIARYRKEATEMLDDAQLRTLEERLRYLRELEDRRTAAPRGGAGGGVVWGGGGGRGGSHGGSRGEIRVIR